MRFFWLILICLSVYTGYVYYKDDGLDLPSLDDSSTTSKDDAEESDAETAQPEAEEASKSPSASNPSPGRTSVTPAPKQDVADIEAEAKKIEETLSILAKDVETMKLYEPKSPYAGKVTLQNGNASAQSPESEYLTLNAVSENSTAISITGWKLESVVTKSEALIPEGARLLVSENDREKAPIMLSPGETAYVVTGLTPLRVSFRENECSGYLSTEGSFSPSLTRSCPLPGDELLQYGSVKSSDARCSEYVRGIGQCEVKDASHIEAAELSGSCEMFISNVLTYEGCVEKHRTDKTFYTSGAWRVYLNRTGELWRSSKDVVRLLDAEGKVVSVLEY
jgi:hypothetical protein